jgi:hypothetical protein
LPYVLDQNDHKNKNNHHHRNKTMMANDSDMPNDSISSGEEDEIAQFFH